MFTEDAEIITVIYTTMVSQMQSTRTTMVRVLTGFLTVAIVFLGWAISSVDGLPLHRRLALGVGLTLFSALFAFLVWVKHSLFNDFAGVISRINTLQGMYTEGRFGIDVSTALFPKHWKTFGDTWREPIFLATYAMIATVCVFGIAVVFLL